MSSRLNVALVLLVAIALVATLVYVLIEVDKKAKNGSDENVAIAPETIADPIESVRTDITFEGEEARMADDPLLFDERVKDIDQGAPEEEQFACTLEAKMCPDGSFVGREGPKCEFATCPTADGQATTSGPLPSMTITVNGEQREGVRGSYCWNEICEMSLLSDIPSAPVQSDFSDPISYTIVSQTEPERVLYFLKEVNGTKIVLQGELSVQQKFNKKILLEPISGQYLLFITGVWKGGQDVVHAFKLDIKNPNEPTAPQQSTSTASTTTP